MTYNCENIQIKKESKKKQKNKKKIYRVLYKQTELYEYISVVIRI